MLSKLMKNDVLLEFVFFPYTLILELPDQLIVMAFLSRICVLIDFLILEPLNFPLFYPFSGTSFNFKCKRPVILIGSAVLFSVA